NLTALKNVQD
ncbi:hypothetical protein MJO28_008106, partial [Puccinia striiformis f. sp. tritici]